MELLKSKRLKLPVVYFVSDRAEVKDVPIGIPFIFGDESVKKNMVFLLEFEILYQAARDSGFTFNFKKALEAEGFKDVINERKGGKSAYIEYSAPSTQSESFDITKGKTISENVGQFERYVMDASQQIDMQTLKDLNVFPVWLATIEEAIHTNIHNFATYNENMYNKKLEGMYGSIDLKPPSKNLVIIDISGSIPRGVSATCLTLAKNLAETFYADLMITGSKTTLYGYDNLGDLNVKTIYEENGMDNDQIYFKELVTKDCRNYSTAIVFGDGDEPGHSWSNSFNIGTKRISNDEGKKLCQWTVDKLINFHTGNRTDYRIKDTIAGYARWFKPKVTEHILDWVIDLK